VTPATGRWNRLLQINDALEKEVFDQVATRLNLVGHRLDSDRRLCGSRRVCAKAVRNLHYIDRYAGSIWRY